jgi:hypothetical protein
MAWCLGDFHATGAHHNSGLLADEKLNPLELLL